jgi:hypothetical protein
MEEHSVIRTIHRLLLAALHAVSASAAISEPMTFYLAGNGGNCVGCEWVAAQGEIMPETPELFQLYVKENGQPHHIVFNSPGGNLLAGIRLGQLIREAGATTLIGETLLMGAEYGNAKTTVPGECASACVFAFMGGEERFVGELDRLGVHQFYSTSEQVVDSEVVQALVGYSLIHTLRMGIDAGVIVAASGTSPKDIHWFSREELSAFGLDTGGASVEPWGLEPYRSGLVLTTRVHSSSRRSVAVTLFCRTETRQWHILLAEQNAHHAKQLRKDDFFQFSSKYASSPTLSIGEVIYSVTPNDVEFQRISEDQITLSLYLPQNMSAFSGETLKFDPDFPQVFIDLLSLTVDLPSFEWMDTIERNCI